MHGSFPNKPTYNKWVSALWATAKDHGMDDLAVRQVAGQVSGGPSVRAMSMNQFKAWFKRVEELYGKKSGSSGGGRPRNDRKKKGDNIIWMATPEQKAKIRLFARNDLKWEKGWNESGTECVSISKIITRHTKGRKEWVDQLTIDEARSVIEALKKIHERKRGPVPV